MKRILFVDDEKNTLDGLQRMTASHRTRWEMMFVSSGQAALAECEKSPFDVVVSDLRMPGMDGAELLGEIRSQYPATVRIILSGYTEGAAAARAVPVAHRVLAKPCGAEELKDAIERVCTLQDLLSSAELQKTIGTIGELPSLSTTFLALSKALRDPNTSILLVASIIEQDVAMSAKILQLVNSAFFGLAQRVASLQHAVSYLGIETIKNLALYYETFRVFVPDARIPRSFLQDLHRRSQRAAGIAAKLSLPRAQQDIALAAALLHEVGTLVMASSMPTQFCAVLARMKEKNMRQFEAEEELLGISHAEIGAYLLGLWGIDSVAVEAIAHHHHPNRIRHSSLDCSTAIYLSSLLADELDVHPNDPNGEELSEMERNNLEGLGLLFEFPSYRTLALEALN